jgi:hypothetical protein
MNVGNVGNVENVENEWGNVTVWRMKMPDMPMISLNKRVLLPTGNLLKIFSFVD